MKSPFKFLDPYVAEDHRAFFGRDEETKELYQLATKNRLTVVYGPSGTGKTSLVQCGLASRFGGSDWLPIFIRRGENINDSLRSALAAALGYEHPGGAEESIGALFNRYLRPVYLIFDQFEELFILGKTDEQQLFYDDIAELLEAELPCRLLFILREDYFGHLNQFEKTVPELFHRKLRVEPMNRDKLLSVITGSCRVFDIGFDDQRRSPELILDNIMAQKTAVHMPYVQVYLYMLYQEAAKKSDEVSAFSDAVIRKVGPITDVLGRFLQEQKSLIFKELHKNPSFKDIPEDVVAQVLDVFVTTEGTKAPVGYSATPDGAVGLAGKAAQSLSMLPPTLVSATVLELERSRILRRSDDTFELAHDTLAALIDQQRSVELRQLRDVRQRIEAGAREHAETVKQQAAPYYFDKSQLARIEPFLPKLALEPAQEQFLRDSREAAERLEKAEIERTERELRLAEENLANEQKARQRQRYYTLLVALVAAFALLAFVYGLFQSRAALAAKDEAVVARNDAEAKARAALHSDSLTQEAKRKADLEAENAKNALAQQIAAERAAKEQQIKAFLAQAADFSGKKQYENAIAAYRSALGLAADARVQADIRKDIARCEADKRSNDFTIARERGLRLAAIGECKAAIKYLEAALSIQPNDPALVEALKACRAK